MTHRQDLVSRTCVVCGHRILPDQWMMDMFRSPGKRCEWAHEDCVRSAMEKFITMRREKKVALEREEAAKP